MAKTIFDMMQDDGCSVKTAKTITSKLFRQTLYDKNYNFSRFSRQLDVFVKNLSLLMAGKLKSINSIRGNVSKELVKPKMTWSNFTKAVMFFGAERSELNIVIIKNEEYSEVKIPIHDSYYIAHVDAFVLTKAFSKLKEDLGLTTDGLIQSIDDYLNNPKNRVSKKAKVRNSARGNLSKEIRKEKMTWLNFEKGLQLIDPDYISFTLTMHRKNRSLSNHVLKVVKPDFKLTGKLVKLKKVIW